MHGSIFEWHWARHMLSTFCHLKDKGTKNKDSKKAPSSFDFVACSVEPCCQSAKICSWHGCSLAGTRSAEKTHWGESWWVMVSHVLSMARRIRAKRAGAEIETPSVLGWCRFHRLSDLLAAVSSCNRNSSSKRWGKQWGQSFLVGSRYEAMDTVKSKTAVIWFSHGQEEVREQSEEVEEGPCTRQWSPQVNGWVGNNSPHSSSFILILIQNFAKLQPFRGSLEVQESSSEGSSSWGFKNRVSSPWAFRWDNVASGVSWIAGFDTLG